MKNLIIDDNYFLAYGNESTKPGFVLNFGKHTIIEGKRLLINSMIQKRPPGQMIKEKAESFIQYYRDPDALSIQTSLEEKKSTEITTVPINHAVNGTFDDLKLPAKMNSITVKLNTKQSIRVLRVKKVEIVGRFLGC